MGLLDDVLADDSQHMVDSDVFGEQVTYRPLGGGSRTINAVVDRQMYDRPNTPREALAPLIEITVRNDSTYGISGSEINRGGDAIRVAVDKGKDTEDLIITAIVEQDDGILKLRMR